jgi:DNA-binding NtrC family response regulator
MLQSADVNVSTADSREQAMALLNAALYDVVIADLMLDSSSPEDGLKILRHVKTHCEKTKVIVITGSGEPDIMERAYAAGADEFYAKPVGARVLKDAIGRMCT